MTWRRALLLIVVLAAAIPVVLWLDYYRWAGGFREVSPRFAGTCRAVEGVPGPEDLLIDHRTATAYVSSYDRGAVPSRPGAILAYDLNQRGATPRSLTPGAAADFRPHGISLHRDAAGRAWLHVINHPRGGDTVEIFELRDSTLAHVRTVRGAPLTSANDVVAVAPDRFYVTNSRRDSAGLRGWLESYLRLSRGNVVYYDGLAFHIALEGVAFPNGIDVSGHTGDLYVVSSFDQSVRVYARDVSTGALTFRRAVSVGTRLDNVNVAPGGDLWVAGRARYLGSRQPSPGRPDRRRRVRYAACRRSLRERRRRISQRQRRGGRRPPAAHRRLAREQVPRLHHAVALVRVRKPSQTRSPVHLPADSESERGRAQGPVPGDFCFLPGISV